MKNLFYIGSNKCNIIKVQFQYQKAIIAKELCPKIMFYFDKMIHDGYCYIDVSRQEVITLSDVGSEPVFDFEDVFVSEDVMKYKAKLKEFSNKFNDGGVV
jgi:hypothetical protein